jgi:hypothetical protein
VREFLLVFLDVTDRVEQHIAYHFSFSEAVTPLASHVPVGQVLSSIEIVLIRVKTFFEIQDLVIAQFVGHEALEWRKEEDAHPRLAH